MNSKNIWRATLPLIALIALGSAHAESDGTAAYATLADDSAVGTTALRSAIDPLFDDDTLGHTQSLLVMRDGRVIAERYGEGIGPDTKLLSRSIAKSVTAVLVGLMVSDGRLALDSPVPLAVWSQPGDPRGAITLRHLLHMTSGLEHREEGDPLAKSDTVRMLFTDGAQDMAAYAESKPIASRPGRDFVYSSGDSMILSDLMTRMLTDRTDAEGRRAAMDEFIRGRLAEPVGLRSLTPEYDARGSMIGGVMMHMTTRDYARFGEFLRLKGKSNGRQLLSARWVDFMTTPSERNTAYGGQLWLNRQGAENPLFPGRGPRSLFACVGHHGQYVIISPAQRLVIVRMGISNAQERVPLKSALARLVELFPAG
jgi:CubicO group peptidase (beta-lactamase class C family)